MAIETRTLATIPSPGTWAASSGDLVLALAGVGDTYATTTSDSSTLFGNIADFAVSGAINAVRVRALVRLAETGSRTIVPGIRLGPAATTRYHVTVPVITATEWTEVVWEWATNPDTLAPWASSAEVDVIDRVYLRAAGANGSTTIHVDSLVVELDYEAGAVTRTLPAESVQLADPVVWFMPVEVVTLPSEVVQLADDAAPQVLAVVVELPAELVQIVDGMVVPIMVVLPAEVIEISGDEVEAVLVIPPPPTEVDAIAWGALSVVRVYVGAHLIWAIS